MTITVFLADDHAVVRDGLRCLLEAHAGITVVGVASNGREAVREVIRLAPDVVIMDISMPELNGIDAAGEITVKCKGTQVIILSMHSTAEHVFRALKAGARGFLLKDSAGQEVVEAVRSVHAGNRYFSTTIADTMVKDYLSSRQAESPLESLSQRERQILQLVVEGKSSAEIATALALSPKTVESYRSRLMQKIGVGDLPALVKFAIQHGLTRLQ
jgi:DNA-binding NarL/FixJ family response regulator